MTAGILAVTAFLASWGALTCLREAMAGRQLTAIFAGSLALAFNAIALGAGIQLLFRG